MSPRHTGTTQQLGTTRKQGLNNKLKARAFRHGGTICTIGEARDGDLDQLLPVPQPPADPAIVAELARYVTHPD
jgi:hypothetical protein